MYKDCALIVVSLNVEDKIIVFGSTIHLLCTLDDSLDLTNGRSRQWSGGSENKVLSFNGFPSDLVQSMKLQLENNNEFN
jgi:hypothetical protein